MVGFPAGQQRAHDGLGHHHQHAAFQAVAGDVANADLHPALVLQDIEIIATHLHGGLHVAGDIQALDALKLGRAGQQHELQAPGDLKLADHAQVLGLELGVESRHLGVDGRQLLVAEREGFGAGLECLEQSDVLDRYHRLGGEGFQQRDLFVREWSHFPAANQNRPNGNSFAQQRRGKRGAVAEAQCELLAFREFGYRRCRQVMDMDGLPVDHRASGHPVPVNGYALLEAFQRGQ